ncbi:hypothetical protein RFI_31027 [Reticulomyxa filosa]|uniref:Uncharacterized protein n=1 Tax=Reticulomyxa filosa TaxID=46433 RepID=X6LWU3_RETFI|nr:hypothetical protein RFI_31027 [Reticulomyxa filosa]|eukprot:ETO06368.1 hypothetical protein RFI_31027 [Reticulomyxa filosa]
MQIELTPISCEDCLFICIKQMAFDFFEKIKNIIKCCLFYPTSNLEIILYSSNKKSYYKTKNNFSIKSVVILCIFLKFRNVCKQFCCQQQQNSPFSFSKKMSKIRSSPPYNFLSFPTSEEKEAFFRSLLEECISSLVLLLKVKTTTQRPSVRMSQSKHYLKYVQEYLRMAREVTMDKENLEYLNYHKMFYICDMTDNLQYWMIVVEKESFAVCCENGGLPSHNILSSLQFFKMTHHNVASTCLNTAKSMMQCNDIGRRFMESFYGHDFLIEDVLMYSGELLLNETRCPNSKLKTFRRLEMQRYLEKFFEQFRFFKEKGKIF